MSIITVMKTPDNAPDSQPIPMVPAQINSPDFFRIVAYNARRADLDEYGDVFTDFVAEDYRALEESEVQQRPHTINGYPRIYSPLPAPRYSLPESLGEHEQEVVNLVIQAISSARGLLLDRGDAICIYSYDTTRRNPRNHNLVLRDFCTLLGLVEKLDPISSAHSRRTGISNTGLQIVDDYHPHPLRNGYTGRGYLGSRVANVDDFSESVGKHALVHVPR